LAAQFSLVVQREAGQYSRWCPESPETFKLAMALHASGGLKWQ